jgi:hypothetical protein
MQDCWACEVLRYQDRFRAFPLDIPCWSNLLNFPKSSSLLCYISTRESGQLERYARTNKFAVAITRFLVEGEQIHTCFILPLSYIIYSLLWLVFMCNHGHQCLGDSEGNLQSCWPSTTFSTFLSPSYSLCFHYCWLDHPLFFVSSI